MKFAEQSCCRRWWCLLRKRFVDTFDERQRMGYGQRKTKKIDKVLSVIHSKLEESLRIFSGKLHIYKLALGPVLILI